VTSAALTPASGAAPQYRLVGPRRHVSRYLHEDVFQRMQQRTTPEVMRLRAATVELPFAALKYRIFGHPRFLLRGLAGAQTEIGLATLVYNLKRMMNILGWNPTPIGACLVRLGKTWLNGFESPAKINLPKKLGGLPETSRLVS
jgi:DDE family transposase